MAEPNFEAYGRVRQPAQIVFEHLERVRAERIYFDRVRPRLIELERRAVRTRRVPRSREDRCQNLHSDGLTRGINVDDIFADTDAKLFALGRIMGYRSLRGVPSFDDATPAMIGEVYRKDFYLGKRSK
jgi:hypothetical protein